MASGEARSVRRTESYRASLPKASPAAQSIAAFHSSRQKRRLLAPDAAFKHDCSVHDHRGHCTHPVCLTFLAHLLRRATSLNHFAAARRNCVFYHPQRIVANRAARRENFDCSFPCHSIHLLSRSPHLHPCAATLIDCFAGQLAQQFSVLLFFAAARLHLFTGESAHHLRRSSRCHSCDGDCCQQRQPFCY